jgi:hypothetical protein
VTSISLNMLHDSSHSVQLCLEMYFATLSNSRPITLEPLRLPEALKAAWITMEPSEPCRFGFVAVSMGVRDFWRPPCRCCWGPAWRETTCDSLIDHCYELLRPLQAIDCYQR